MIFYSLLKVAQCIRPLSIRPHLKVQMIARRVTGAPHVANHLALLHLLAGGHANAGAVGIKRVVGAVVGDLDIVAVAAAPRISGVGHSHGAACRCQDRCTIGRGDIGAAMVGNFTCEWVAAVAKTRCDGKALRQRPRKNVCARPVRFAVHDTATVGQPAQ